MWQECTHGDRIKSTELLVLRRYYKASTIRPRLLDYGVHVAVEEYHSETMTSAVCARTLYCSELRRT